MKKVFFLFVFLFLLLSAKAQFRASVVMGLNNTTIGSAKDSKLPTSRQFTSGLEIETLLKGKHLRSTYFSVNTGAYFLKNGYNESYYYTGFTGTKFPIQSLLETTYVEIPVQLRLYIQPMPLIETWTIFLGGGISNNLLLKASLNELTVEQGFGTGVQTYSDNQNITDYGQKSYLFSTIEIGMMINRFRVIIRQKKSLQDMYFQGLNGKWGVPADRSTYMVNHDSTGKLTERHIEVLVAFTFLK